jgi:hypothetical protein
MQVNAGPAFLFFRTLQIIVLVVLTSLIIDVAGCHLDRPLREIGSVVRDIPPRFAVPLVIFIAASISSTVGFAFSAIAAAMIFHLVPDHIAAVQIMMVASIALQTYSVASMYRTISLRACAPFIVGGIATLPTGIYLLLNVRPAVYILCIGVAVALYGSFMLFRPTPKVKRGGMLADLAIGALGGFTGPLAAFPGAFLTIWCGMRGWTKIAQRSIYQPYILILQVLSLVVMSFAGDRAVASLELITYALPAVAGAWLGLRIFQKLTDVQFQRLVNVALIISGVALVLR